MTVEPDGQKTDRKNETDQGNAPFRRGRPVHVYMWALAVVVALAGLMAAFYVRTSGINDAEVVVERGSIFTADLVASEIQAGLDQLSSTTTGLAATPNLGDILKSPESCSLTFAGVGLFPEGRLDIIDPGGTVVCSSDPAGVNPDVSYGSEPWFEQARRGTVLEGPVTDVSTGGPSLVHAVAGDPGLVVAAFLDLEELGPELSRRFGGPRDFEFLVVSDDGNGIVSRSIDARRWTGAELPGDRWSQGSVNFERDDLDGVTRLYGQASVPELGWTVYVGAERAAVLAPAEDLFRKTSLIIGLGIALTFAALWFVWRRIARPIRSLRLAVRGATSNPEAGSVQVGGPAEVVALGEEFDALLSSVSSELAERKRAEEALRASERTYRLLFDKNPEPMWIYDVESLSFLEVNDTACEHYGYPREQWLKMTVKDIRPAEDVPALLESVAKNDPVDRSGPWRHIKADGSVIEVEITSHEIEFDGRRGRFVMADDVTKRNRLEKQLEQSQRLESLGQLAGGIAHDFNNLLSVILNYSTFVGEALEQADQTQALQDARGDVEQISSAAKRAASLTHRLLTFARKEVVNPEVVSPNDIIEEVEKLLTRTIGEEIEFKVKLAEDIWPIRIDLSQLQQVIMNLAVNARDAMPEGGSLTIETSNVDVDEDYAAGWADLESGHFVRIRVSDTGTGMEPEVANKIFDPFFSTKPTGQGTGLGLATVHGIVAQAGGSIHVYTEPGIGTSMSILLPTTDQPVSAEEKEPVRTLSGKETVLVVEDEDAIREVMRRMLTRHGYEVILAESGAEAIAIAEDRSRKIDLVITDVVMPGMLGREITERISALRPETRLIYMSGYAQAVLDSRGRLEPGRSLVEKPFSEMELLAAVREALEGGQR